MARILIVDDQDNARGMLSEMLQAEDYEVDQAPSGEAACLMVAEASYDLVITDLRMGDVGGLEVLQRTREASPLTEVIVMTAFGTVEDAVEAMRFGAHDFVQKPFVEEELLTKVARAARTRRLAGELRTDAADFRERYNFGNIIGQSAEIRDVLGRIVRIAPTDATVLITGESGTGKELVARAVHQRSQRAKKPMVTINCAALQESLLESELFGHEKGAFTGATTNKLGLFEVADGGTLFIDELGELAPSLQAKLLRVLEDGHMRRVGSTREKRVDVRIVAATNRNLTADVAVGRFREDLFFRINVLSVELPPLRQRRDDIPLLTNHFLRTIGRDWSLDEAATTALSMYSWPGNIRELHNVIERASILSDGNQVTLSELPHQISNLTPETLITASIGDTDDLDEREGLHVQRVLNRENWNRNRTAESLGINRRSLFRLIQKHGLQPQK